MASSAPTLEQLKRKYLSPKKKTREEYVPKSPSDPLWLSQEDFDYLETKLTGSDMEIILRTSDRLKEYLSESSDRLGISLL
jgi:hypothetical protein